MKAKAIGPDFLSSLNPDQLRTLASVLAEKHDRQKAAFLACKSVMDQTQDEWEMVARTLNNLEPS